MTQTLSTSQFLPAPELLTTVTQPGLEVFQLTTDPAWSCNVFYNYLQAFEPTSRFLLFNRVNAARREVVLCDLEDGFSLRPVNEENGYIAAAFSPDGQFVYYNVLDEAGLLVRRRSLADWRLETVFHVDRGIGALGGRRIIGGKWLSFSHDSRRLLVMTEVEGQDKYFSAVGLTFDLWAMTPHTVFDAGTRATGNKSQYAPCPGPDGEYLIGMVDNYARAYYDAQGGWHCNILPEAERGNSCEYLVDEHGQTRYAYPVGRDRPRQNIGHWAWFGRTLARVFHVDAFDTASHWRGAIMLADPVEADDTTRHLGRHLPGGKQVELTRYLTRPDAWHLCVDDAGEHLVCDTFALGPTENQGVSRYLYACTVKRDARGPYVLPKFLLNPHSSWVPYFAEALPCMTPDRRWIFFNSDYNGVNHYKGPRHVPQVFAVRGFEFP